MQADLLLLLAAVGVAAALMSFKEYMFGGPCTVDEQAGCGAVYALPQARILGVHFSVLAPLYFMALLAALVVYTVANVSPAFHVFAALLAVGVISVPYLVYLEVRVARAICIYCTVMHVVLIAMAVAVCLQA